MFQRQHLCTAVVFLLAATSGTQAATISLTGLDSGQQSTSTVVVEFNSQTNTTLFTVTNTSAITQPGSTSTITAIGFDLPPLGNASASGLNGFTGMQAPSLSSSFSFSDANLGNVPGVFNAVLDFGFITGPSGSFAAGATNDGLLPGESASFTVSGAAFTGFIEDNIAKAIFVFYDDVSTPQGTDVGTLQAASVPAPASLLLVSLGLTCVAARVRLSTRLTCA